MSKKGQIGIETIMFVFIAVLVGLIVFQASAQNIGEATTTGEMVNVSINTVVNGTAQYITTHKAISDVIVCNESNAVTISSGNYTVNSNVIHNGDLAIEIIPNAGAEYLTAWKISGTVEPLTYIDSAGGRSMAGLIVIFFALAVGIIALYPVVKNKFEF